MNDSVPNELVNKVKNAFRKLLDEDYVLLIECVHERTVAHKFAEYLQSEFSEHNGDNRLIWNVDCEYDKGSDGQKIIKIPNEKLKELNKILKKIRKHYRSPLYLNSDIREISVFPDVIVHKRGKIENLLVIEMKKKGNNRTKKLDIAKLELFTSIEDFKYRYGLYLEYDKARISKDVWFGKDGKIGCDILINNLG